MLLIALILANCLIVWLPLMHPDIHNPSTNFAMINVFTVTIIIITVLTDDIGSVQAQP